MPDAQPSAESAIAAREAAHDELVGRMLTPRAEIRLGPGLADTERLMRRASSPSLSYTIRSLWAGIVEYVFPPHGLFRRGDILARVYDPEILADLERARMDSENVRPLTIAAPPPRRAPEPAADDAAEASTPERNDPSPAVPARPAPAPAAAERAAPDPPAVPDFDFEANRIEQEQLREQAELAGTAIPAAIQYCRNALVELNAAQEELAQRHRLLEQGALAEQALRPAEERVAKARAAYERAEAELVEAQEGYDRIAARICALETEAEAAHEAIRAAREEKARHARAAAGRASGARQSAPESGSPEPPEISLERRPPPGDTAEVTDRIAADEPSGDGEAMRVYRITQEMRELAAPRWEELAAEAPGVVSEVLAPEGAAVEAGGELLRVANLQLARVTARVAVPNLPDFQIGRSVTIEFEDYPDAVFGGWVSEIEHVPSTEEADVGLLVVCQAGRFANDPYLALRWITLEAGVGREKVASFSLDPVLTAPRSADTEVRLARMFPTVGPGSLYVERAAEPTVPVEGHFTGRLRLQPMERLTDPGTDAAESTHRLAALREWRRTYVDGMTTAVLDNGALISYPANGDVSEAVRLMLEGRVNHRPNLCAATMREALGWGLGDAHQWATRLPHKGYVPREDGLPRPGDILVWPFTYGPDRSQHIGFAVRQGRKLMLLSNLSGRLGTTEVLDGYIAFYKPEDQPDA